MIRRAARVMGLLATSVLVGASPSATARAAGTSRLYTAGDFPRLKEGIRLPESGEYTVKVWAPARQRWELKSDGPTLNLSAKAEGDDGEPAWQALGKVRLSADEPAKVRSRGLADGRARPESSSGTTEPVAVPALLFLSTDPDADPAPLVDLIRGQLDRTTPPDDPRRTKVRTNREGADFRPPATAQAWRDRARAVREQMLVALGLWPMPPKTSLHPRVYGKVERDGYTIEKVVLETMPGFYLGGNLYRPKGATGRVPALLCPHGHWEVGRVQEDVQNRCIRWAKLGCVVFLYDMVGYNDSKPFGHAFLDDRLRRWGLSLATLQTWNSIRALDWLTTLPDVDAARIGCTGESGGGTQTFLLTALDERVKVAAPVVMVSEGFQGGCVCENAAGLRLGTDNVEFAALTAPRPLKLVGATGDWTAQTMFRPYPAIRQVYALVGSPDRVSADIFNFPHNYNQTSRNAVYAFMAKWLLNVDDPASTREGDQTPEKPEDLRAFNSDHPAPADFKTPEQLEGYLVDVLGKQLDGLAPGDSAARWQAARDLLRTAQRVRLGVVDPAPAELGSQEVRRSSRDGVTVLHVQVGRLATAERIPVVRLIPGKANGRLTVILHPRGKAGLLTPEGRWSPLVRALLDRGHGVVGLDPLLIGESVDPSAPAGRRPEAVHYETYNPALAADRAQDLATVLAWARSRPDVLDVSLVGEGSAGPLALLARPSLRGLARTAVDLHEFDYGDGSGSIPSELDLPGVLQFGGLEAAAALCAPEPLRIARAGGKFKAAWPERAYALDDATASLRLDRGQSEPADLADWIDQGGK